MFFTRIGKFLAYFGFWTSVLLLALAVYAAYTTPDMEANREFAQRYLSADTTGEAIDRAMRNILLSIGLGILCEISAGRRDQQHESQAEG